jgi:GNAT superfamily N-acetyltransferase
MADRKMRLEEWTSENLRSMAGGFVNDLSCLGETIAGSQIGALTKANCWHVSLYIISLAVVFGGFTFLPLWNFFGPQMKAGVGPADPVNQKKKEKKGISFSADVKVRPVHEDEYLQYIQLLDTFRPVGLDISSPDLIKNIEEIRSRGHILVLVNDGLVIGAVTLLIEQKLIYKCCKYCHIEDVIVSEHFRGKGYGQILLREAREYARKDGCLKCVLNCAEATKTFYTECGFEDRNQTCLSTWDEPNGQRHAVRPELLAKGIRAVLQSED